MLAFFPKGTTEIKGATILRQKELNCWTTCVETAALQERFIYSAPAPHEETGKQSITFFQGPADISALSEHFQACLC